MLIHVQDKLMTHAHLTQYANPCKEQQGSCIRDGDQSCRLVGALSQIQTTLLPQAAQGMSRSPWVKKRWVQSAEHSLEDLDPNWTGSWDLCSAGRTPFLADRQLQSACSFAIAALGDIGFKLNTQPMQDTKLMNEVATTTP